MFNSSSAENLNGILDLDSYQLPQGINNHTKETVRKVNNLTNNNSGGINNITGGKIQRTSEGENTLIGKEENKKKDPDSLTINSQIFTRHKNLLSPEIQKIIESKINGEKLTLSKDDFNTINELLLIELEELKKIKDCKKYRSKTGVFINEEAGCFKEQLIKKYKYEGFTNHIHWQKIVKSSIDQPPENYDNNIELSLSISLFLIKTISHIKNDTSFFNEKVNNILGM